MLTTLRIQNLAIVDQLEVAFRRGLNVVTGETGAGKSILVGALQLVLGGRAQADLVRAGSEEAVVEAHFEGPELDARLERLGLPPAEGELVIRRVLARSGRGRITINGALSTVAMLAQVGRGLVDLSGQHEHVTLLEPGTHLALLDAFAGLEAQREGYRALHLRWVEARRASEALALDAAERSRKIDYLAFQLRELEALDAQPGEEALLAAERKRLASAEKLLSTGNTAQAWLSEGEGSALEQVARALARVHEAEGIDPALRGVAEGLRAGLAELDEASRALGHYLGGLESDPTQLGEVEERLEGIPTVGPETWD